MSDFSTVEKAEAYLQIHLTRTGPAGAPDPVGPFITISRQSGTGGSRLAQALSQALGEQWSVYSGNLIDEMLRMNHLPAHLARYLPEDRIRPFNASVGELVGLHPDLWTLVDKTNELIRGLARAGHAILLGRGGAFATAELGHGVHVRLIASETFRAQTTARWLGVPLETARAYNARRDAARARYVRSTFGADIADPTNYDLVLDVERLPFGDVTEIVRRLAERESPARRGSH